MRIVYYTYPSFLDCDLPLLKALKEKGVKILILINLAPYSLQSTILDIEKQISKNDILKVNEYKELMRFNTFFNEENVYIVNRTHKSALSPISWFVNCKVFFKILKFNPNVIHCTSNLDVLDLFLYMFRKKILITQHDPFPHSGEITFRKNFFRGLSFKLIRNYLLLNTSQRKEFIETTNLAESRVFQSKLGVYSVLNQFKQNKVQKDKNAILFFGRISPYKGLEFLLEAMEIVHKKNPTIKLIIAGKPNYNINLDKFKDRVYLDIRDRFIPVEELVELIQLTQFSVCPYLDATQSGVIMSCFNFNQPVIATDVGALGEVVEDGITGYLVKPKDIQGLANAILSMSSDYDKVKEMEENINNKWTKGGNSWEEISNDVLNAYLNISK